MGKTVTFKVVGMTFLHELPYGCKYPDDYFRLQEALESAKIDELGWFSDPSKPSGPMELLLFRNPDNVHDSNAIEVHAPTLGRRAMLGHVPKDLAAKLAPSMDRGDEWKAVLDCVLVDPGHEDKPGVQVVIERESVASAAN